MTDIATHLYAPILEALRHLSFEQFTEEMAGTALVLLLLALLISMKKRGKNRRGPAEHVKAPGEQEAEALPRPKPPEAIARPSDEAVPSPPSPAEAETLEAAATPKTETVEAGGEIVGLFERLKTGLSKTRLSLSRRFDAILSGSRGLDEEALEEIEEALITSDIGAPTTMKLMERISRGQDRVQSPEDFKRLLKKEMLALLEAVPAPPRHGGKPHVIMVVGVNGVGKTTTIGKLAAKFTAQGKKVLLAAGDTFRAAAADQLAIWAERADADLVRHKDNSDPAAVAFDSVAAAEARGMDVVIIDTAGRLHTKVNLMEELKKIRRSIGKKITDAPHETLLIVDATTGQNAVSQAKLFHAEIGVTGIVLTKLDGTAKGGIVLAICDLIKTPVQYIGVGEGIMDLQEFDARLFVDALF